MTRISSPAYLFVLFTSVVLLSCQKAEQDPIISKTPSIKPKSIHKFHLAGTQRVGYGERDSVVVTIAYQDADNDLGEQIRIDTVRYKAVYSNQTWGNFQLKPLLLSNGQYAEVPSPEYAMLFFSSDRNRYFSPSPFEFDSVAHTIAFKMVYGYPRTPKTFQITPTKFRIKIRDRQLNESNEIETDTVYLPYMIR